MKKYTFSILLLIIAGIYLGYLTFKQSTTIDESVYIETSESIRFLKTLDTSINLLLFRLNYERSTAYSTLDQLNVSISDEFDVLRFEALFEEIERSPVLDTKAEDFGDQLIKKQRSIDQFIEEQKKLRALHKKLDRIYRNIQLFIKTAKSSALVEQILEAKINFYLFLETFSQERKGILNNNLTALTNTLEASILKANTLETDTLIEPELLDTDSIKIFIGTLSEIISTQERVREQFLNSVNSSTTERLDAFEQSYANFHNGQINESKEFRSVLIIYGLVLFAALLILAYLLRKQYLNLESQVKDRTEKIAEAYSELQESQEQLIQSEKMASLGEMVAGIAHEINTPLGYINGNVSTIQTNTTIDIDELVYAIDAVYNEAIQPNRDDKKLSQALTKALKIYKRINNDGVMEENRELLTDSKHGLGEISELVQGLKNFSRLDRQTTESVDIHECIESSLKIASHHIKQNDVDIKKHYGEISNIVCTPSKLNQLFLNVITNSCQAMKNTGSSLSISTRQEEEFLHITFSDDGEGMDEATSQKMFDPFFTTKPIGEGTGLGMSISYKIIQEHNGHINVESKPNKGTSIVIQLPLTTPNT